MKARKGPPDLDRLQGVWHVAAVEMDGQPMAPSMLAGARIEIQGGRFRSLNMGAIYEGDLRLDPAAAPKSFDLVFTTGPEKGNTNRGIYEFDGDQWRLCLATRGGVRPREFATRPNTGHALQTLRRASADASAESSPAPSDSPTELEGEWSMVSGFLDGKPMAAMAVQYGLRSFHGNRTTLKFGPETYIAATFTLHPDQSPCAIDYVHTAGMFAGKTQLGIYECDGKTLKLSSSPPGHARPTDFREQGDHSVTTFVLSPADRRK